MAINGIFYNVGRKLSGFFYIQNSYCFVPNNPIKCMEWDTTQITCKATLDQQKYAIVVLNRPIALDEDFMTNFWNNATVRLTADGGTVKWDQYISKLPEEVQHSLKPPNLIIGDFDSITTEVLEKYKKKGCKIVHTPDQNYTDFTKALMELDLYCRENKLEVDHVIAICQSSGRLDQILGNIQTLFLNKDRQLLPPKTKLYIMSDDTLSWLLCPGDHVITVPEDTRMHKRAWCSLVPVGEACTNVTSSGLKWNLNNQPLKFGELVSTSNAFSGSEKVTVKCSHTLLWSMKIPSLKSPV